MVDDEEDKKDIDSKISPKDLEVTEEDVKRNIELFKKGEPLDRPLRLLDGKMKYEVLAKPSKRDYNKEYLQKYKGKNRVKLNAYKSFYFYKKNKIAASTLAEKIEWCLWFLHRYHNNCLKERGLLKRKCIVCGKEFSERTSKQKYCSKICRTKKDNEYMKMRMRMKRQRKNEKTR